MEWVIIEPLHFLAPLWQIPLGKRPAKLSSEDPSGQWGWRPMMNATWQEWWFPCLPLQPIRKKTGYSILQLWKLWSRRNDPILSHTHTPTVYADVCVCVFNLLPLQGQIAGFQHGRGLYLENSWNILESKPNVGQFNILNLTSFKIL